MSQCPISGLNCPYKKDIQTADGQDLCIICGLPYLAKQGLEKLTSKENLVAELINFIFNDPKAQSTQLNFNLPTGCKTCGQTLEVFIMTGRIGCGDCYEFYRTELLPVIERCQNTANQHVGKSPNNNKNVIIKKLEEALSDSIKKEDYETAKLIKARIQELSQ